VRSQLHAAAIDIAFPTCFGVTIPNIVRLRVRALNSNLPAEDINTR
jgi:hypothetical protein